MSVHAFAKDSFSSKRDFCLQFLSSVEFNAATLKELAPSASSQTKKEQIVMHIAQSLDKGELTLNEVLLAYVKQPRKWLSIKQGRCICTPNLKSPALLLEEFGDDGWYGPIQEFTGQQKWYVRTYKIIDYIRRGSGETSQIDKRYIRWTVVAEVSDNYVALSWEGFTFTSINELEDHEDAQKQFSFWLCIPGFFDELADYCKGQWFHPNLHQLILHNMWDKYLNTRINDYYYKWKHLRIRAEAAGLALNAHSSGVADIDVRGLQALSQELSKSVLKTLGLEDDVEKTSDVENAILLTLIKGWGTKSYEFSLDRVLDSRQSEIEGTKSQATLEHVLKAHCYFGLKPNSKTQDSLQHLRCYVTYHSGSTKVLKFLLRELGLRG